MQIMNNHGQWRNNNVNRSDNDPKLAAKALVNVSAPNNLVSPQKQWGNVVKDQEKGSKLRIIPLGGLEEIGKNMTVFEYENNILIIDMGLQFPEEGMLGIDYVIPDMTYLESRKHWIKAILITHGHLDHIGAIPHLLPKLNFPPIYGTKLTMGLIQKRLEEFALDKKANLQTIDFAKELKFGCFSADFFRINHSIPDGAGVLIRTPVGNIVHSGDFKFDFTPADQSPADFSKIARIGSEGVLAALLDSTNANRPGFTPSEQGICETLDDIVSKAKGRLIVASFSSLIGRIQQVINSALKYNRKIFISGRSMLDNIDIAEKLGYIRAPKGLIRKLSNNINSLPSNQVLVLTTGSQGESMSALTRIALGEHAYLTIKEGDTVVLSSSPIVGNERAIYTVINNLCAKGAKIISNSSMDVHVSGHAYQGDLKLMYSLLKPKFLIPVHGELYMRMAQKEVAMQVGIPANRILLVNNGDVIEATKEGLRKSKQVVPANHIVIDGLGVGDIGTQIIRDRKTMAHNGVIVLLFKAYEKSEHLVGDPEVISRGFVYVKELAAIAKDTRIMAKKAYNDAIEAHPKGNIKELKNYIKNVLIRFFIKRLNREPMILPLIVKV
jgi:ribonuclease J